MNIRQLLNSLFKIHKKLTDKLVFQGPYSFLIPTSLMTGHDDFMAERIDGKKKDGIQDRIFVTNVRPSAVQH